MNQPLSTIKGGVYLVLNPSVDETELFEKLELLLANGLDVVQVWNHWRPDTEKVKLLATICLHCQAYNVPVFINEEWKLLQEVPLLQGVHFDNIPSDFEHIQTAIGRPFLKGITCTNESDNIQWAIDNGIDYISFCSMFPSSSADNCSIVMPATVKKARALTNLPIFLAGGMTTETIHQLGKELDFDGVAVVSSLWKAPDPKQRLLEYKAALESIKHPTHETENH